jgi:hypothetical protein
LGRLSEGVPLPMVRAAVNGLRGTDAGHRQKVMNGRIN